MSEETTSTVVSEAPVKNYIEGRVDAAAFESCEDPNSRSVLFVVSLKNGSSVDVYEYFDGNTPIREGFSNSGMTFIEVAEQRMGLDGMSEPNPVKARKALAESAEGRLIRFRYKTDTYVDRAGETVTKRKAVLVRII